MRPKATEVRLIARLLEEPAEDTNDLATKILNALADKRAQDDTVWVFLHHWGYISVFFLHTRVLRIQAVILSYSDLKKSV